MKFFAVFGSVLLAQVVLGEHVIKVNYNVDSMLKTMNDQLTADGNGILKLPDLSFTSFDLKGGFLIGANSHMRKGDCFLRVSDDNTTMDYDILVGYGLMDIAYGSIKADGVEMSGIFRVKDNVFRLNFQVVRQPGSCVVTVPHYEFITLSYVSLEGSLPEYKDVDVSYQFTNEVLPTVNQKLAGIKGSIGKGFEHLFCEPHKFGLQPNQPFDALQTILSSIY